MTQQPYLNSLRKTLDKIMASAPSCKLRGQLERFVIPLIEMYKPNALVLTGSLAAGLWVKGLSDIDLLLITEKARDLPFLDRFRLGSINGVNVNISIFTRSEIIRGVNSLSFFFIDALDIGIPLFGHDQFSCIKSEMKTKTTQAGGAG